ncbi:MAG: hypothetical protein QM681_11925 [Novosphingobium sp.]
MSAQVIADKFRRALRKGSGATFSLDQLKEMAGYGILKRLAEIESDEILASIDTPRERPMHSQAGVRETPEEALARAKAVLQR